MSKIVLVTGGSRSGKSVLAENKAFEYGDGSVLYIATAIATDEDMKEIFMLSANAAIDTILELEN